ncbi:death-associated 1 protein kinase, partial [Mytilus galloprovincialis]
SGECALHVAARYGHSAVIAYLVSEGAELNLQDTLGDTALHSAAWHGFNQIVASLSSGGADLNKQNKDGETSLHCAAARGYLDSVKTLLDSGAPINQLDKEVLRLPRQCCSHQLDGREVKVLTTGLSGRVISFQDWASINHINEEENSQINMLIGCTALHLACNRRHSNIAMLLIHAGCNIDTVEKESGDSPLNCAVKEGMTAVVQTMCGYGCQPNVVNKVGLSPLHIASKDGQSEIVRALLLRGANPDLYYKDGVTAEIMALAQGRDGKLSRQYSLPIPLTYSVSNPTYTKGINVQQTSISDRSGTHLPCAVVELKTLMLTVQ